MTNVENFNGQSIPEEIANAISHGIGAILAIAATAVLIVVACFSSDAIGIVSSAVYGFSLIVLYAMSTVYHAITNPKAKKVLQVFDHCSIFILILGSYAPICLALLRGSLGWTLFGINAAAAIIGITLNAISVKKWHKISLWLYLIMGWSVIFLIKPLLAAMPWQGFALLLAGGLSYSLGVIFYRAENPRFMHAIWHLFVLGGSAFHYFFVLFYAIPIK